VFLEACRSGKVKPNSVLIVESLDRLSRQNVMDAFAIFQQIINAGIEITTLTDGMRYTKASLGENVSQLFISLSIMMRAHEESATKSKRLRSVWAEKRKRTSATKEVLTHKLPQWLKAEKGKLVPIPERVALIHRILQMTVDGIGKTTIAKTFNRENVPTWDAKAKGWHASYIGRIVNNRILIGEYQPKVHRDGERIPEGEPVLGYYPAVVPLSTWQAAQAACGERIHTGGRRSVVASLFSLVCGECGGPMHCCNSSRQGVYFAYYYCADKRRGGKCTNPNLPAEAIERDFLDFFASNAGLEAILETGNQDTKANEIEKLWQEKEAEAKEMKLKEERLMDALEGESDARMAKSIKARLAVLLEAQEALEAELPKLKRDAEIATQAKREAGELGAELQAALKLVSGEGASIPNRQKAKTLFARAITKIEAFGRGTDRIGNPMIEAGTPALVVSLANGWQRAFAQVGRTGKGGNPHWVPAGVRKVK